jgi:Ca-activated chloride channel homolog
MDNQDKIFDKIKSAAHKAEENDFPAFEKVWMRVEEKLDQQEDKKAIALWKKLAVAASLLLFFSLGYQFLKTDSQISTPKGTIEKIVVVQEKAAKPIESISKTIKPDAEVILKKEIAREKPLVVAKPTQKTNAVSNETELEKSESSTNNSATATILEAKENTLIKEEKIVPNAPKTEAIVALENNAKAKMTTSYDATKKNITGIVIDEANQPLAGASVYVKGTKTSTSTDLDGKFIIQAEKGDQLVLSFIGYENSYVTVGKTDSINIKLTNSSMALNEVVVVGYGKQKKINATGAMSSISTKALAQTRVANINNSLPGRVTGVFAVRGVGEPYNNDASKIRIRGAGTFSGNTDPLVLVDGIPVANYNNINQDDIKSLSILKDASSTAIYGSRGINGVMLITTKKGVQKNISKEELEKRFKKVDKTRKIKLEKRLKKLNKKKKTEVKKPAPKSIEVSQEDYDNFVENPFESPKSVPLSTFSIDVDNASYTNVRRFINNGQTVPKDAVRVEEMVNFFKYNYPQPQDQHPLSISTEYSECPWNPNHKVLKIGLQGKNIPTENLPASNLVFLIDVSGSMSDANKLPLLKQSLKILVNELRKKDKVAIVVYAGAVGMLLPPTKGDQKQTIIDALENLNAGGGTAGGAGIELAYQLAQENFIKGGNNRVILATDGDFNVGASSNTDMQTLIEEKRKSGVFLTCLGYGMGNYKDSKMEILSDKGNGNYAYIDNIQEANRFLGKEFKGSMFAIAKDVKIQIEFNPKQVQAYRLIGYENRKLRPEDFTNDAIDAGELGSNHTITALYEVIPTGIKSEFLNNQPDLKYTKVATNENEYSDELATIKFRYKKPDGDKSTEMVKVIENKSTPLKNASDDFKFSTAVAWFGLKLRDSNLVPNKATEDIKKLAKEGLSNDEDGYKAEFIRLVETVK